MDITLHIQDKKFEANKELLSLHSDYFQAMFSGNFIENEKTDIIIDVVDANSMEIILQYITNGFIDLFEFSPPTLSELALSAHFLQMTELLKQIEYTLYEIMNEINWLDIVDATNIPAFSDRERKRFIAFGLCTFNNIKPEYVTSIKKLHWYLSHPDLIVDNELKVFEFGLNWILLNDISCDALLIVLSCLDYSQIMVQEYKKMIKLIQEYKNSLALKILNCILEALMLENKIFINIDEHILTTWEKSLKPKFTERVYSDSLLLIKESVKRQNKLIPCVSILCSHQKTNNNVCLYKINSETVPCAFEKYIEVSDRLLWGWGMTNWGYHRLVIVGGEYGRGTGMFNRQITVYDTLRDEFNKHGELLPYCRHAGLAVIGNELFIVGGVGKYRITSNSTIIYDLKKKTYRKSAEFPDAIQDPPICVHKGKLYAGGHTNIYRLNVGTDRDSWELVLNASLRFNCIISFNEYIYGSQELFTGIHKFRPDKDQTMTGFSYKEIVTVKIMCDFGKQLLVLCVCMLPEEEDNELAFVYKNNEIIKIKKLQEIGGELSSCCPIVMELPSLNTSVSNYVNKYINMFNSVS